MKNIILIIFITLMGLESFSQNVNIPDANFKNALLANPSINTLDDGEISVAEAEAYTGDIYLRFGNIANLSGIEAFINIKTLDCSHNQLTSLDLSSNTVLKSLICSSNQLTSLDLSANTALTTLNCSFNQLTSLDVSATTALISLDCNSNQMTNLDISANTALTTLNCGSNQLKSLDISVNTALTDLSCGSNQLTNFDISDNPALTNLSCGGNQLTSLDLSANTALNSLDCGFNQLASLDVSGNIVLTRLSCSGNQLTSLDVSANTALTNLSCAINQFTSLDVGTNTALTDLSCSGNQLTSLDVSANTALTSLLCSSNALTSLDVSTNTALTFLDCHFNQLTSLDVNANTALKHLSCGSNVLTSLDVSANIALTSLDCRFSQLTSLDVSTNTALTSLLCSSNALTSMDVSGNTALTTFWCSSNALKRLDVSGNTALTSLICSSNALTSLDLSTNIALTYLDCYSNHLISLNLKNGTNNNIYSMDSRYNLLTCIVVDNVSAAHSGWRKDATTTYCSDAPLLSAGIFSSIETASTKLSPFPLVIIFSKEVTGFDLTDLVITNGTVGNLQTLDNIEFTVDMMPMADGKVTVDLAAGMVKDLTSNPNTAATQFSIIYDAVPTVVISTSEGNSTNLSPFPVTITFSEAVTGFELTDLVVANGATGNLQTLDDIQYTVDVTPTESGVVTVDLAAGLVKDLTDNLNTAAVQLSLNYGITLGLPETEKDMVNLYPNPTQRTFKIDFREAGKREIKLLSLSGRLVRHFGTYTESNVQLKVDHLKPGIYLVQIDHKKGRYLQKLIIK